MSRTRPTTGRTAFTRPLCQGAVRTESTRAWFPPAGTWARSRPARAGRAAQRCGARADSQARRWPRRFRPRRAPRSQLFGPWCSSWPLAPAASRRLGTAREIGPRSAHVRSAAVARPGAIARAGAAARRGGRRSRLLRAGDVADVSLRLVATSRDGVARFVVDHAAAVRPLASSLGRAPILFGRLVLEVAGLFGELAAQLRPRLRREQHPQPRAQHGAGEQPDDEAPSTATLVFEAIVSVSHDSPPMAAYRPHPTGPPPRAYAAGRNIVSMATRTPRTKPMTRRVFARMFDRMRSAVSSTRSTVERMARSTRCVSSFTVDVTPRTSSRITLTRDIIGATCRCSSSSRTVVTR